MQLKMVVLPAPLGPISPTIWPRSTSNETSSLATSPPKRLVTWRTSSRLIGAPRPTGTSAGPPRGRGPAWERPGARPAKYRSIQDVSSGILPPPHAPGDLLRPADEPTGLHHRDHDDDRPV